MLTIALRPVRPSDSEFLYRVYANTRYEELAPTGWSPDQTEAFLRMQFRAQHTYYHDQYPTAAYDIIESDGEPVGRLYVHRTPTELHIIDISLLPEHRRAGIGSELLRRLFAEATAANIPVRIHVEVFNPAMRLYKRLGFVRLSGSGVYDLMEWRPPGLATTDGGPDGPVQSGK